MTFTKMFDGLFTCCSYEYCSQSPRIGSEGKPDLYFQPAVVRRLVETLAVLRAVDLIGLAMPAFEGGFWIDEQGQDLIEYTLLLAFVCIATAALFTSVWGSLSGIWSSTKSQLAVASTSAS